MALCAFVLVAACGPPDPPPPPPAPLSPAAADVADRANHLRSLRGTPSLQADASLRANAQFHADRLAAGATTCFGTLWHSPELSSWYAGFTAAENIACITGCPSDGAAAVDLWWNDPPHRDNMMRADFTRIGVATRCSGSVEMVVAHFRSG